MRNGKEEKSPYNQFLIADKISWFLLTHMLVKFTEQEFKMKKQLLKKYIMQDDRKDVPI